MTLVVMQKLSWTASRPAQNITGNENVVFENKKAEIITVISKTEKTYQNIKLYCNRRFEFIKKSDIQEVNFEFDPEVFSYELQVPLVCLHFRLMPFHTIMKQL